MTNYLLDTNVLIGAYKLYYSPDICPAFLDWIMLQNERKCVSSIDRVIGELSAVKDDLYSWSCTTGCKLFEYSGTPILENNITNINNLLEENEFTQDRIHDFGLGADIWLISYALSHDHTLVKCRLHMKKCVVQKVK